MVTDFASGIQVHDEGLRGRGLVIWVGGEPTDLSAWQIAVDGYRVPLRLDEDPSGPVAIMGLRFRSSMACQGLHPGIAPHGPIELRLTHPAYAGGLSVTLFD